MERPGDVRHVNSADHVHIIEECFPDEDPSANLTAWQVIAKDVLQPLMPLLPEESVPFIQENPVAVLLGAASVLMLIAAAIFKLVLHSVKLKTIVLYGPMEAGKTSLLHALQGSELPNGTVSSMKPNEVVLVLPGSSKHVKVIDVPGHPRLRSVFDLHAASASCIIFVLDSSTFVAEKQTVAEQLYHVLQHQACTSPKRGGVIIACNKSDLEERAFSQDFISRQLEKEIESFRASKIADVPGATATQDGLGRASVAFTFQSSTVSVRLCTISASKRQLNDLYTAIGAL